MAHFHDALGTLADHGKSFGQQGVKRFALGDPLLELLRLAAQRLVRERFEPGFQRVDAHDVLAVLLEQAVIATAENFGKNIGGHECKTDTPVHRDQQGSAILFLIWMKWGHYRETQALKRNASRRAN